MAVLPNEILGKIAQHCVEPYDLTIRYPNHRDHPEILNFAPSKNVQLTNKLFAIELRTALRNKFTGKLIFKDCSLQRSITGLLLVPLGFEAIRARIEQLELYCRGRYQKPPFVLSHLPKLQNIIIRGSASLKAGPENSDPRIRLLHQDMAQNRFSEMRDRYASMFRTEELERYGIEVSVDFQLRQTFSTSDKMLVWIHKGKLDDFIRAELLRESWA